MKKPRRRRIGFTLLEVLLTISILSILMGLLFASLKAVRRYSREVSTRTELANLEAAFRMFYDHYGYWPLETNSESEDVEITINTKIINTLSGRAPEENDPDLNPDRIPFFEIFRIKDGNAVNAWGETYGEPYQAKFDTNGDNTLANPVYELGDPNNSENPPTFYRSVIVWTLHPDFQNDSTSKKRVLGSWQQ